MKIGFGAIGKGWLVDQLNAFLKQKGIMAGLVNAGGDVKVWGNEPSINNGWSMHIANPYLKSFGGNKTLASVVVENTAIVTSGDYERFAIIDGNKYSHIINPKTGYPVEHMNSVTVLCSSAELADALATAVSVLGVEEGMKLLNQLKGVEGLVVKDSTFSASTGIDLVRTFHGLYWYAADAGIFTDCKTGINYQVEYKGKEGLELQRSYLKLKRKSMEKMYVQVKARLSGTGLLVYELISIEPEGHCPNKEN